MRRLGPSILAGIALAVAPISAAADDQPRSRFGVMTDIGVPDGAVAAVAVRPIPSIVTHAGAAHNSAGPGARAGARWELGRSRMAPFVALELGAFPDSAPSGWMQRLAARGHPDAAAVDRFAYAFGSAHLGLRFGGRDAAVYLQGGWSYLTGTLETLERSGGQTSPALEVRTETPFRLVTPSGRFGLVGFF